MFTVADAMGPGIVVRPDHPARDLLESHVRRHGAGTYELVAAPLRGDGRKRQGLRTAHRQDALGDFGSADWATLTVAHVMLPAAKVPVVSPGTSTTTALVLLHQGESDGVLVIDDGDLVGVVTLTHLDELLRKQDAA